ncbi:MAG: Eco57I restriction-modification methylase domain-containing protein [Candidatus Saccharimonas sp.]
MIENIYAEQTLHSTFSYGVVYIYSIPGEQHAGRLKIGAATLNSADPTQEEIEEAAHHRIRQQTKTADIRYRLEFATLGLTNDLKYLSDYMVHNVLIRSGYERAPENASNARSEWFRVDLATAKNAIQAAKEGRAALNTDERLSDIVQPFDFRPNQLDAIERTNKAIKQNRKHFLWNAKMRFGKTSTAMQVAKENEFEKVLIVTHRPSVSADWYDDFNKVFAGTDYQYSSKDHGESLRVRLNQVKPFVYFASMQDLRLSEDVVSDSTSGSSAKGFAKNKEIFSTQWDMLIVDEAHEGTQSKLGDATLSKINANFTLELSGTPFNILHKHEETDIYTWDYVMEQRDKLNWDAEHPGVPNPYAELPALSMFTYDIDTVASHVGSLDAYMDALDGAFKFHEFFRVHKDDDGNDTAEFIHETMVNKFLDLLVNDEVATKFPYATDEYRGYIKHSLWLLPNRTKAIEAMEKLLNKHPVFSKFKVVNISGNSTDDEADKDAKKRVRDAIDHNDYTITLTGQRLTTGASIPEWTAVFMLSDTNSATTYLQTAFRCQTPAKIDGMLKTQGYVFDFAPDRTLKLVAEAVELNHKSGSITTNEQKQAMREFLNFCPILAAEGGGMRRYDVGSMLDQLKKAIIERVSRNGFDDPKLYNDELMKLDEVAIESFNGLRAIVGTATNEKTNEIKVNDLGMTDLQRQKAEEDERKKKPGRELTEEEKELRRKLKEAREQKKSAISILRGVSIRMPMLVYGANVSYQEDISLDDFIDIVDDESWLEFMPAGLTKQQFREFTKYYDQDVFRGVTRNIRAKAFDCDQLLPVERIEAIAEIFATFKNPDKETVLTPWNVVNLQFNHTLGGADFRAGLINKTGKPEWITRGDATKIWSQDDARVLEINSKSGLYPLLAAYNMYDRQLIKHKEPEEKVSGKLWRQVLANNIYVLCKSPMAATITRRTLAGYTGAKMNIAYIHDLVPKLRGEGEYKGYNVAKELCKQLGIEGDNVKFTAVVGNPPYQVNTDTNFATPVYHLFIEAAKQLNPDYISLIHPARFLFNAGATPKDWNEKMLNDPHLSVPLYEANSQKIFSGVDIKGGLAITLWDKNQIDGGLGGTFVAFEELRTMLRKVRGTSIERIMYPQSKTKDPIDKLFPTELRLRPNYFEKFPDTFRVQKDSDHTVKIVGLEKGNKRAERFASQAIISDPNLENWKVFLPESNGSGALGEVVSTPLTGEPLTGCTGSFVQFGAFESRSEADNCMKYLKTRFCRVMLGTLKITQHNPKSTWKNVPLQDFSTSSDIDWSQSIADIDKQLYAKYNLDQKEIDFIETRVRAME